MLLDSGVDIGRAQAGHTAGFVEVFRFLRLWLLFGAGYLRE